MRRRLGQKVRELRKAKGWSQEEFAELAELHRTYVSAIERGVQNPTITVVDKLATTLGTTIGELSD